MWDDVNAKKTSNAWVWARENVRAYHLRWHLWSGYKLKLK